MLDPKTLKQIPVPNYGSRHGKSITHIVIHSMIGTTVGTTQTFLNKKSQVSAHYAVSRNGDITQYVRNELAAWHVCDANPFTLGIELEDRYFENGNLTVGSMVDSQWWTAKQLDQTAQLTALLMSQYKVPITNVIGHNNDWLKQFGNNHHDPGPFFPWKEFQTAIIQYTTKIHQAKRDDNDK